ncbi:hypothetical protein SHKM778_27140 [Streptomyces sp. KM77-8]|uniref:Glycosyltransferase 2-like domain-containing protein n=1 Tax=Streptomyces haneummycinicus TaxID=3074435 RepID=A0AAT9HFS7_9ACTN
MLPVFNEQDGIRRFHDELVTAIRTRPELSFELVYVNDGSSDASLAVLRDLAKNDPGRAWSTSRATSATRWPSPPDSTRHAATRSS